MGQLEIIDNFFFTNYLIFGVPGLILGLRYALTAAYRLPMPILALASALMLFAVMVQGYGNASYCLILGLVLGTSPSTESQT